MSEIPADVMEAAKEAYERYGGVAYNSLDLIDSIARAIMAERERCAKDADRLNWLEQAHTLHWSVEFLYVVEGYNAQRTYDGNPTGPVFHGESLREAIDAIRDQPAAKLPKQTVHASTSPGPVNCSIRLRHQGRVYPRTCERCGLGPCPFFHKDGTKK